MLQKYKLKREEGFTIIEVLIVLAIAGLIMLIVFLAVPALQRNSRNSARNNEASRMSAAVTDCLSNHNGTVNSCNGTGAAAAVQLGVGTTDTALTNYQQFDSIAISTTATVAPTGAAPNGLNRVTIRYGVKCLADGSGVDTAAASGATARDFVVLYAREPLGAGTTRCVGSQ